MWYLYDDPGVMYPQLVTAAYKAECQYEVRHGEGVWVKLVQAEGKDEITTLRKQIAQLWVVMQKPVRTASDHPRPLGNRISENRNVNTRRGNGNGQNQHERHDCNKVKCFNVRDGDSWHRTVQALL